MVRFASRLLSATLVLSSLSAQDWCYNGGDSGGSKYALLKQIDKANLARLQPAWTYHPGDVSDGDVLHLHPAD